MARRTVTDHTLPDGVYPYAIGPGDDKQKQRYYAKLATAPPSAASPPRARHRATRRPRTPHLSRPSRRAARSRRCGPSTCARAGPTSSRAPTRTTSATGGCG